MPRPQKYDWAKIEIDYKAGLSQAELHKKYEVPYNRLSERCKEMVIINKSVSELVPYARNSRTHSDEQVAQIMASIKEFGFTNPILTDGKNGIIAGHGRLIAAQRLGIEEVPT